MESLSEHVVTERANGCIGILVTHNTAGVPDSKLHGVNMRPIWGRQDPGGPHVGPMNFAIWGLNVARAVSLQWSNQTSHIITPHTGLAKAVDVILHGRQTQPSLLWWWPRTHLLTWINFNFPTLYDSCNYFFILRWELMLAKGPLMILGVNELTST